MKFLLIVAFLIIFSVGSLHAYRAQLTTNSASDNSNTQPPAIGSNAGDSSVKVTSVPVVPASNTQPVLNTPSALVNTPAAEAPMAPSAMINTPAAEAPMTPSAVINTPAAEAPMAPSAVINTPAATQAEEQSSNSSEQDVATDERSEKPKSNHSKGSISTDESPELEVMAAETKPIGSKYGDQDSIDTLEDDDSEPDNEVIQSRFDNEEPGFQAPYKYIALI